MLFIDPEKPQGEWSITYTHTLNVSSVPFVKVSNGQTICLGFVVLKLLEPELLSKVKVK